MLSLLLFNLYAKAIFDETLNEMNEKDGKIILNCFTVNNIRYKDDCLWLTA